MKPALSERFHIPSLEGIRAVAAMLVFVAHAGWHYIVPGGFGVTIFFFLSGYLITTLLRREYEQTGDVSFKKFYLRRAYRIFPPLYIVLLLIYLLAIAGAVDHQMRGDAILSQVLFWTNYYNIAHGGGYFVPTTGVYWSLAIEEHFYFLFPLLFWLAIKQWGYAGAARLFLGLCVLALLWRSWLALEIGISWRYTYAATDTRFDSLLFGCILGVWNNPVYLRGDKSTELKVQQLIVLVAALILLITTFLYRAPEFRQTLRYTIQGVALLPLFWLAIRHADTWAFRWLNYPPIKYLGLVSFTFYLCHGISLEFAGRFIEAQIPRAALGFTIALAFSAAMYSVVEKPIARYRRRLHQD
jgi:peptidoglycan/LPS O-acetylase OafA/YrhL